MSDLHEPGDIGNTPDESRGRLPRNVVLMGITSFLADISSEMLYPFIPIFLTTVLGAPVAAVGLIEGIAESTASLVKVASGWWSDRVQRRLPQIEAGYGLAAIGKLLLAVATVWPLALFARFVDRFGKGMRGSARDALIAESIGEADRGRAFGFHRTLDTAGAVVGPLIALLLAALFDDRLRLVFALAVIPGFLSIVPLLLVREPVRQRREVPFSSFAVSLRGFDRRLTIFLVAGLVFALANSSDVFLILRAKDLGLSTTAAVLAYVVYNIVYMVAALPAGIASDRRGRRDVYVAGLLIFAIAYTGFAVVDRGAFVWPLFAVYGLYIALTDGVSRALITDLAPADRHATALGAYGTLTGVATLVASVTAGQLWDRVSAAAPFLYGAGGALVSAILILTGLPRIEKFPGANARNGKR